MPKFVKKEELIRVINSLLNGFEVIGPRELIGKGIFYGPVAKAQDLYLGEGFTTEPVKKYFLEPSACLCASEFKEGKTVVQDAPLPSAKRIILGVRPCEARGLTLLDKVFDAETKDKFYINNRQRTMIVGLACIRPDAACFCTSMGGTPVEERGLDVLLVDTADGFIVECVTDKGKGLFGSLGVELDQSQKRSFEASKQKSKDLITKKFKAPDDMTPAYESDYWAKASFACLGCGVCTYVCPTCHCFDLVDEKRKKLRCYDGCAFVDFTLEASGENPRPTRKERYRQRVFHKFDYFKKNFGENLCVGCGRCIRHCPVKIDIAEVACAASARIKK